jgi:hypothetical protein
VHSIDLPVHAAVDEMIVDQEVDLVECNEQVHSIGLPVQPAVDVLADQEAVPK